MADDSRKRNRLQELDLERQLIDKDHMMYNRERVQQLEARQHKTNSFINSNNELLELKRTQLQRDVIIALISERGKSATRSAPAGAGTTIKRCERHPSVGKNGEDQEGSGGEQPPELGEHADGRSFQPGEPKEQDD